MKCPNCSQTVKLRKDGLIPFHKMPKKTAAQFGGNYVLGAYCGFSRCGPEDSIHELKGEQEGDAK